MYVRGYVLMLEVMFGIINNFRLKWHTRYSGR